MQFYLSKHTHTHTQKISIKTNKCDNYTKKKILGHLSTLYDVGSAKPFTLNCEMNFPALYAPPCSPAAVHRRFRVHGRIHSPDEIYRTCVERSVFTLCTLMLRCSEWHMTGGTHVSYYYPHHFSFATFLSFFGYHITQRIGQSPPLDLHVCYQLKRALLLT